MYPPGDKPSFNSILDNTKPLFELTFLFFSFSGNGRLASCTTIVGFVVMMSLDVGLGWEQSSLFLFYQLWAVGAVV